MTDPDDMVEAFVLTVDDDDLEKLKEEGFIRFDSTALSSKTNPSSTSNTNHD